MILRVVILRVMILRVVILRVAKPGKEKIFYGFCLSRESCLIRIEFSLELLVGSIHKIIKKTLFLKIYVLIVNDDDDDDFENDDNTFSSLSLMQIFCC